MESHAGSESSLLSSGELGELKQEFTPATEELVAGVILGIVFTGLGIAGLLFAPDHVGTPATLLFGLFIIVGVGAVLWTTLVARKALTRVTVYSNGLRYSCGAVLEEIPWDQVTGVKVLVSREHLPIVKGPLKYAMPSVEHCTFVLRREDGFECRFGKGNVRGAKQLGQIVRHEAENRGIPWYVENL